MISSLSGDCIGSAFEFDNKRKDTYTTLFSDKSRFTDDTVMTIATADAILNNRPYAEIYYEYAVKYPDRGYGTSFTQQIAKGKLEPYNSYGNGSAMRVSPIGWAFKNQYPYEKERILEEAKKSAECTHNHPEGIKGAQAIAYLIWLCKNESKLSKEEIGKLLKESFDYDLSKKTNEFEKKFDVTCQGTIPRCFAIFNESNDFESAMRLAISIGGDVDTNCCIVGGLCEAYYGFPKPEIVQATYERLPKEMADVTTKFVKKYIKSDFVPPLFVDNTQLKNSILSLEI